MANNLHGTFTCCVCGKTAFGWGCSPWPINNDPNAVCCRECNFAHVLPARVELIRQNKKCLD